MMKRILLALVSILILVSCSSKNPEPPIDFVDQNMNTVITLIPMDEFNQYRPKEAIFLTLIYDTKHEIRFSNDYDIRIFYLENNEWVEINEVPTTRLPPGDIILSPNSDVPFPFVITVQPDLPDEQQIFKLRVYIFGVITEGGYDRNVAAYTEFQISPNGK